jgi:hypothetical protein
MRSRIPAGRLAGLVCTRFHLAGLRVTLANIMIHENLSQSIEGLSARIIAIRDSL